MASITLDLVNYQDDDSGTFDGQVIHDLTRGLQITFDEVGDIDAGPGELITSISVEFTGSYEDLIMLIDRYEDDPSLRPGLIADIVHIHS